jgi:hypothetical protein
MIDWLIDILSAIIVTRDDEDKDAHKLKGGKE